MASLLSFGPIILFFSVALVGCSGFNEDFLIDSDGGGTTDPTFCELSGSPGLDLSYASDGFFQLNINDSNNGNRYSSSRVALDSQDRAYLVGKANNGSYNDVIVHRVDTSGASDSDFGTDGTVTVDLGASANGKSIRIVSDEIFVAVNGSVGKNVLKMGLDGSLDSSFGTSGVVSHSNSSSGDGLEVSESGFIYQTGHTGSPHLLSATRFTPDGNIDTALASSGYLTSATGTSQFGYGFQFDDDQDQFFMFSEVHDGNFDFKATKYNATDGSVDTSFGTSGSVVIDAGGTERAVGLKTDSDGNVYMLGGFDGGNGIIAKLDSSGTLDSSFGDGGIAEYAVGDPTKTSRAMELLFLESGTWALFTTFEGSNRKLALGKINSDGSLDTNFSDDGLLYIDWPGDLTSHLINTVQDSKGRVLVSFSVRNDSKDDLGLVRLCL